MVDAGEVITATLRREFGEEALNSLEMSEKERAKLEEKLEKLFNSGTEVRPVCQPTLILAPTLNFFMALFVENYLNTLFLPSNVVFDV